MTLLGQVEGWKLWLDDQIDDSATPDRHVPIGYEGARSTVEAQKLVNFLGPPAFMDLDHDLGGDDTCRVFLRWLADTHPESIPEYHVHSANPLAKEWVDSFMSSWKRSLDL